MIITGKYPNLRMRRARMHDWSRDLCQETHLLVSDLILPLFLIEEDESKEYISSMPGVKRHTIESACSYAQQAQALGIKVIALFPVTPNALKTQDGQEAINPDNLICRAIKAIKAHAPNIGIMTDVALDPYTSHGHDGLLINNEIDNDQTIALLAKQALVQAQAGADIIAPSDMQDGRIAKVRQILEDNALPNTLIMSYAAKYASALYGPFRDAVGSSSAFGKKDKKSYQQNPANHDEALCEVALDLQEGADMVMIKPALSYLDVIYHIKQHFKRPTFAYQVSGEYSMVKAAAANGWLDERAVVLETLLAFRRAGADLVITYHALDAARWLAEG